MSLGTGAKKGWWGVPRKGEAQQGGLPWRPCEREPASTITMKKLQWKYLPNTVLSLGQTSNKGEKGQGRKLLAKHCSNTAIITKL